ncbi:MAG: hypothetical protein IJQ02_15210 [Oscillospiraceae bacterium]|nr:hypothetical protein [Oscillospiraceae bacterium]
MKLLRLLFSGKPARQPKPKKERKSLGIQLLDKLTGYGLDWLKSRWNADLWRQDV